MDNLIYLNGMGPKSDYDVEVHAVGCKDSLAKLRSFSYDDAGEVPSMRIDDLWREYNIDFLDGDPEDAWPIAVFPCTSLVKKVKVYYGGI